ncbi:hypothetical protein SANTM175S_08087 [Streptomyces antimycoticus]
MLQRWSRRATSAQALALRARIVLACAGPEVPPIVAVARELRVAADQVRKWRRRFLAERLDGLTDEPRPGPAATISVDQVEAVVISTLEEIPKNATHSSRASMADRSGLSKSTVGRIWRRFQLKPHLGDTFELSTDPLFVEKVYDVVGLYFNPPEGAVVLSVDETGFDLVENMVKLYDDTLAATNHPYPITPRKMVAVAGGMHCAETTAQARLEAKPLFEMAKLSTDAYERLSKLSKDYAYMGAVKDVFSTTKSTCSNAPRASWSATPSTASNTYSDTRTWAWTSSCVSTACPTTS